MPFFDSPPPGGIPRHAASRRHHYRPRSGTFLWQRAPVPERHEKAVPIFAIEANSLGIGLSTEFAEKPRFCERPVAGNRVWRDIEDFGGFFNTEPAKKTQFDHFAFSLVDGCQAQ